MKIGKTSGLLLFALLGILAEGSEATGTPIDMRIYDELSFA